MIKPEMFDIERIVTGYIKFNQRCQHGNIIHDSSILPWAKQEIVDACLQRLERTENPNVRRTISHHLLQIAFYQDGVGEESLRNCHFDLFPMDLNLLGDKELAQVRALMARELRHLDPDRFIPLLCRVQAEFKKLNETCEAIEKRYQEKAPAEQE
jgi:hypothetical protein